MHDKLVHRHPHVFSDVDAADANQVVSNWEAIKKSEKGRTSVTEGIPSGLPALMLTTKLARKARSVGLEPFDSGAPAETAAALASLDRGSPGVHRRPPTTPSPVRRARSPGRWASCSSRWRTSHSGSAWTRSRRYASAPWRSAPILAAEGVPDQEIGNR